MLKEKFSLHLDYSYVYIFAHNILVKPKAYLCFRNCITVVLTDENVLSSQLMQKDKIIFWSGCWVQNKQKKKSLSCPRIMHLWHFSPKVIRTLCRKKNTKRTLLFQFKWICSHNKWCRGARIANTKGEELTGENKRQAKNKGHNSRLQQWVKMSWSYAICLEKWWKSECSWAVSRWGAGVHWAGDRKPEGDNQQKMQEKKLQECKIFNYQKQKEEQT